MSVSAGLRVLALVSDGFGAQGGIAAYNHELLAALAAMPDVAAVRVLALNGVGACPVPDGVLREAARPRRARFGLAALARGLARRYDWVFCGHLHLAPLARVVSALAGARLWLQLHGIEAWRTPGAAIRGAVRRSALVTVVSRVTRRRFLAWADVHPGRVRVLSNTFDPVFVAGTGEESRRTLRREIGAGEGKVLLTVSRLAADERYKGHDQVMRALVDLSRDLDPPPLYVIAGEGGDRARLERLAESLGIAAQVHFTGVLPRERLAALYRACDVFVMPSTGEGFGIVFLEAAACGVPVIGGDGDGACDALRDGRIGRLVDARDPKAIAKAVRAALADPAAPGGFEVFSRANFREHLARVLAASATSPSRAERWL